MNRNLTNDSQPKRARPLIAAIVVLAGGATLASPETLWAQQSLPFRPIGSPSAVDQTETARRQRANQNTVIQSTVITPTSYRSNTPSTNQSRTYDPNVRQVAMQSNGFSLPGDMGGPQTFTPPADSAPVPTQPSFAAPPLNNPPPSAALPNQGAAQPNGNVVVPRTVAPGTVAPGNVAPDNSLRNDSFSQGRSLPQPSPVPNDVLGGNPTFVPNTIGPPPTDYAPVPPPQLSNGGFATMSNCALITAPSEYSAMSPYSGYGYGQGCAAPAGVTPVNYIAPPAQIAAPAAIPASVYPGVATVPPVASTTLPAGPAGALIDFGQGTNPVQVGPGLWGQPVAYVPGQGFRNWLRYFSF
ncbi:hypothetical protein RBSH_02644 [Rhodopirellula baltica SH28]|uniref:Uncharacterized protein n=1 Tax=Rhodopirellula baltica SH28 TaxID=993517 RepID=K5E8H3_RHOBT|nr:hypothetical protein [Rhodopirellula baltica]EKK02096.1 hypothetical protein RBSH_02644 [Rhodopirellula baltica SH28]